MQKPLAMRVAHPAAIIRVPDWAWSVLAGVGAVVGAVAFSYFFDCWGETRSSGLFFGAIIGAAGLVGLIAALSRRPNLMGYISLAVGVSGSSSG